MSALMRLIGIDPGLRNTGWGVIEAGGNPGLNPGLSHLAHGVVQSDAGAPLAMRLRQIHDGLMEVFAVWHPEQAAVEETFVNRDAVATLKLGQARGIALLVPALQGVAVFEYAPNAIKKTVVGVGHADKRQVHAMVRYLLPGLPPDKSGAWADAADALAVAICHAHQRPKRDFMRILQSSARTAPRSAAS
jgi:crossover junction endodeoxyribonuclease RuvC